MTEQKQRADGWISVDDEKPAYEYVKRGDE
jgi:hypothetical protein